MAIRASEGPRNWERDLNSREWSVSSTLPKTISTPGTIQLAVSQWPQAHKCPGLREYRAGRDRVYLVPLSLRSSL